MDSDGVDDETAHESYYADFQHDYVAERTTVGHLHAASYFDLARPDPELLQMPIRSVIQPVGTSSSSASWQPPEPYTPLQDSSNLADPRSSILADTPASFRPQAQLPEDLPLQDPRSSIVRPRSPSGGSSFGSMARSSLFLGTPFLVDISFGKCRDWAAESSLLSSWHTYGD